MPLEVRKYGDGTISIVGESPARLTLKASWIKRAAEKEIITENEDGFTINADPPTSYRLEGPRMVEAREGQRAQQGHFVYVKVEE